MKIGELSKHSKLSHDTIRFYEKLGLVAASPQRGMGNNYKQYPPAALERLRQIQLLKRCGFTLREIKGLLVNDSNRHVCVGLPEQLVTKVAMIDQKLAELAAYKAVLLRTRQACHSDCGTRTGLPDCLELSTRKLRGDACCG